MNEVQTKTCTKCHETLGLEHFSKNAKGLLGLMSYCKPCGRIMARAWKLKNPEKVKAQHDAYYAENKVDIAAKSKKKREENIEEVRARERERYRENPEPHLARAKKWRENKREDYLELYRGYNKDRLSTPEGRVNNAVRTGIRRGLRNGGKSGKRTFEALGYSVDDLIQHIEKQFSKGMSWDNYGEWHIDHIVPLASLKYETVDCPDFKFGWSLPNLRPLWDKENKSKGASLTLLV